MNTYVFQADEKKVTDIVDSFDESYFVSPPQYADYCIKFDECTITIYHSGKVVFQGATADLYAQTFFPEEEINQNVKESAVRLALPQAGSDEVGTGDFFGPICVCASYIDEDIYNKLRGYRLIDSKQLTDEYIAQIAPDLIQIVPHSLLILSNEKYNEVVATNNLNMIKAKMHNQAYINLARKGIKLPKTIVIDDFCGEELYYNYLRAENAIVEGITFETKAENKYISVAVSAIIARYSFLIAMKQMEEAYGMEFPKGAGPQVDSAAQSFILRYSKDELGKVAKLNFKNASRIDQ